jgi:hypothetical protein
MPKVLEVTATQQAWMDAHRCVICNGTPSTVSNELVQEHLMLKPAYRHMSVIPGPYEPHMTESVGGEYRCVVTCENDHEFVCRYHRFFAAESGSAEKQADED